MKLTKKDARKWLANLSEHDLVIAWNTHILNDKTTNDFIYSFDDPDEFFNREYLKPSDALP